MSTIDQSMKFVSINIALITISDTRNEEDDKSGIFLQNRIIKLGHTVSKKLIISDNINQIKKTLTNLSNDFLFSSLSLQYGSNRLNLDYTKQAIL